MADELNMDQLKEDCKRQNAMFSAGIVMHLIARIENARAAALNEAAAAVEQHDKTGREWVPGSLWDTISREGAARLRALESASQPGSGEAVDVHSLLRAAEDQKQARAEQLPTEQDCIRLMVQIRLRLVEMGWNFATYAPKDGTSFEAIVAGFTGPSECKWFGSGFFVADKGDWWPATPFMFRKMPKRAAPSAGNGEAKGGRE